MSAAPQQPAWLEPEQPKKPRPMRVEVLTRPHPDVTQRHEYEALFASTFDAYDDALERFTAAERIDVTPLGPRTGGGHAR